MAQSIVPEPLDPRDGFNWVFLVELLICGILTIFFLFYFNRVFATLVSYAIRAYTWRTFHAYIDISSLQISLLGGRIFFKDLRYHGHNETILVHGGHITWNYWLRRVRAPGVYTADEPPGDESRSNAPSTPTSRSGRRSRNVDNAEKGGRQTPKQLPCRISVKLSGVEAFMYNRSPAYDGIIEAVRRKAGSSNDDETASAASISESAPPRRHQPHHHNKLRKAHSEEERDVIRADTIHPASSQPKKAELPAFLRLLPIHLDVNKGAIIVGNENTLAVITAQFEKASGTIDAGPCGPLDVYQQLFNFQVMHPVVHMKPNPDYKISQLDAAAHIKEEAGQPGAAGTAEGKDRRRKRHKRWLSSLPALTGLFAKSSDSIHTHTKSSADKNSSGYAPQWQLPGQERWMGLARYLDDGVDNGHGEWDGIEYAKTSLIADIPCVNLSFYWDVAGPVLSQVENSMQIDPLPTNDINGTLPPEYGMDIQIFGGIINYGPWADRHRGIFQNIFFPGSHVDAVVTPPVTTGETRVLSVFKIFLSIEEDTVLRIPIRESSKDWKWKGKAHTLAAHDKPGAGKTKGKQKARRRRGKNRDNTAAQNVRPFAWIDVKIAGNSSVNYIMDMYASEQGFQNKLHVDVASTEISSSVNHGLLWRSGSIALSCDLSAPVAWNSLRTWMFNIKCQDLELFLLRDHLFLLTDLVADWGAGPPPDYFLFVPFRYLLNVDFTNFKLYLNTNDSNIVNNPADLEDNNFVILGGQRLHGDVIIPLDKFRPLQNEIKFDVQGHDLSLEVLMPPKNTLNSFVLSSNLAQLGGLTLSGSHTYVTETSSMNTDRLFMDIQGHRLNLELYGWLVHHFLKIKDNYFGDDMHFKTLEEFQGLPSVNLAADGAEPNGQHAKLSNDLDVILCVSADEVTVLLPANLYSAERSIRADLPYTSADLRFTNYYMDLMVNFSPISIALGGSASDPEVSKEFTGGRTELFLDSTTIFGHRLFGLPPTEPTYLCSWDFELGRISGECTSEFIETAVGAARSFAFTFDDDENSLPMTENEVIHDATFLRLKTHDVHIWMHVAKEALLIRTDAISLSFNDLAGETFSQRLSACIPDLTIAAVDARSASRHRTRNGEEQTIETHAFLQTTLSLNTLTRNMNFSEERDKQQSHIQTHDLRTNRTHFMLLDKTTSSFQLPDQARKHARAPAMQYPDIPHPVSFPQPRSIRSASIYSSKGSSIPRSVHQRAGTASTSRSVSSSSIIGSIRSAVRHGVRSKTASSSRSQTVVGGSPRRPISEVRYYDRLTKEERRKRNLAPTSVALSSPLAVPYFPLDQIEPDLTDVPSLPALPPAQYGQDIEGVVFNDVSSKRFDETFTHTSLLINAEPGIRVLCTPKFIKCVSGLIELILPQCPEDLLDDFQVKVMTKILENRTRLEGKGSTLELNVCVPFTHVRFQHEIAYQSHGAKDQYDVMLNKWNASARLKKYPGERAGENSLALHTTLSSLGFSATERTSQSSQQDVAIQAEIEDVLLWVLQNKATSINISFRSFKTAAASRKIGYLASLVHRTTILADELVTQFSQVLRQRQHRLRYLVWYLTSVQDQHPDPVFLAKASYALRAARDHLRSHDSWKIISRLRYTWQCLPQAEKDAVLDDCAQDEVEYPGDAEDKIIDVWDQWRTWDLAHVRKSLAMNVLFDRLADSLSIPESAPMHLDLRSAVIKLVIDPGPRQSEVALRYLAINVALLPPSEPSGLLLVEKDTRKRSTIIQANTREATIHVQWEICELAEAMLELFHKQNLNAKKTIAPKLSQPRDARLFDQDIQVVFVAEKAQITLITVNLRSITTGRRVRVAFADVDQKASGRGETLSVHVHMEVAVSELSCRGRSLAKTQFEYPSLYFALVEHEEGSSTPHEIKAAATSRMIVVKVDEDVLGFIEVADSVLRDEVAYLIRQAEAIRGMATKDEAVAKPADNAAQLPNVTLALFMDAYRVELALLQPLGWSISGSSGRIAVVPALGKNITLQLDYDLEASYHRMYSTSADGSNVISTLKLPPVNGRLTVTQTQGETRILASGIIETIQLQASELQALTSTINKPEFSHMVQAVQNDTEVLKMHMEEIFPAASQSPVLKAPIPTREILFGVQMTLSGVHVVATAPGRTPGSATANLTMRLSSVQLKATNIDSDEKVKLYSEVTVRLNEVSVSLTLIEAGALRHCGNLTFSGVFQATTEKESTPTRRLYRVHSTGLEVNMFAGTASAVVDVVNHLQDKIKDLDLSKEKKYLRRLRHTKSRISYRRDKSIRSDADNDSNSVGSGALFTSTYSLELLDLQISWIVGNSIAPFARNEIEDLVLSFRKIGLSTQRDDAARLVIEDMQLQMVPVTASKKKRSLNSALLPMVVFNVAYASTKDTRKVAFQAAGKSLDLQLDSHFVIPANVIERSIALAGQKFRKASANWSMTPTTSGAQRKNPFGNKRFASVTVDANFAGAVVHINGGESSSAQSSSNRAQQKGRYSQFIGDGSASSLALRAPGVAIRVEYQDDGHDPSLNAEVRVDGSSNTLLPTVVPIIIDISESIKAVVRDKDEADSPLSPEQSSTYTKTLAKTIDEDSNIMAADPATLLGRTSLNLGLRICKQEFSLSCQPIARVTAIAKLEDIYVTANSVKSQEHGHFFAASAAFERLQVTVQHVYSRESTFSLDVESIVLSLMNSKHLSGTSGISTILKINPTTMQINARQLQDFLLFREIWYPPEMRQSSELPSEGAESEPQDYLMQRYEQVTAATAFPWNANVAIADIKVGLDLGQAIGRSSLHINNMWASSKKSTDWEQNLCIGVEKIGVESTGRTSGFVELHGIKVRTSISWPEQAQTTRRTPLIQASIAFQQLRVKSGFDYQSFLMADIANFGFLMYNVREEGIHAQDRLVAILDGDKVHVFCHATSAAQGLALYQAIERLVQENQQAYKQSLRDIEKFLRRKSSVATPFARSPSQSMIRINTDDDSFKAPISLHTDVVVTLRSIKFGVFPSTFIDNQILLLAAGDMQARFAVALDDQKIHSTLGMTLGQLSVALSSVPLSKKPTPVTDLTVADVATSATSARGGTILRVPKVVATMHTWQVPNSNHIDYLFKSSLEGKVDVGWNYSRISYIRTMWSNHRRTLASRLGKPLPESNIKISTSQTLPAQNMESSATRPRAESEAGQEKITAVVHVPQSKYEYTPLEPPVIETPQLRDMGEATPPLEWIGLHRDRLPNVTHQIVIVTLLEVAREVEDAYARILGSS
ncbi:hypothetical protein BDU57DRAFT_342824 [Ampelomyces quisqualis]|uniref:Fermentation associated protein n=1 Tax=Ampelomyces quisqualis TaxID=50730 RepID=A0A6A5QEU9_AMPQU|nr:hypothetical protein BDU57DRAFT_342824 [Ampelomyces quisqualis]